MKVSTIVTGADGLVGSAMRGLLGEDAHYLNRAEVDLLNFEETREVFLELKPERVVHLAAQVGGIGGNLKHPGEYFRNNILINTNVLESARLAGAKKLVSYMSTCVFPDQCAYPLQVADLHKGEPHPSNFGYAYAKRMLEVQSRAYRKEWNCNFIVVIPTNIYGPADNFSLLDGHVLPALIHRAYLAKANKEDLVVWGSGKPLREFVFSGDIARLSLWALDHYDNEAPIIFSSGIEVSIADVVMLVVKAMKFTGRVVFDDSKPDGQFRKPSDTSKLSALLPDFQWTSLETGVERTVEWFMGNYPNFRK